MLKLLIFAPCERVILGDDKLISMVALLESVNLETTADLPADALFPMSWGVLGMWQRTVELQEPVKYEQKIELYRPDGERAGGSHVEFTVNSEMVNYRNIAKFTTFPVGIAGECKLKLSLRESGEQNEWREVAEYSVFMKHIRREAAADEKTTVEAAEPAGAANEVG